MLEGFIFNILAILLFIKIFLLIIKRNDANYIYLLTFELIGIIIFYICVTKNVYISLINKCLLWTVSIVLPTAVLFLEKYFITFTELLLLTMSKIAILKKDEKIEKQMYDLMIKQNKNSYLGYKCMAYYYEKHNQIDSALTNFNNAFELNNKKYNLKLKMAEIYLEMELEENAIQELKYIIDKKPSFSKASLMFAEILFKKLEYKEAIKVYEKALEFSITNPELYYNLALTSIMINDFVKAKIYLQEAIKYSFKNLNAKFVLANILQLMNEIEPAKQIYNECLVSKDLQDLIYYNLVKIELSNNELENAIMYANKCLEINPKMFDKIEKLDAFEKIKYRLIIKYEQTNYRPSFSIIEEKAFEHLETTIELVGNIKENSIEENDEKSMVDTLDSNEEKTIVSEAQKLNPIASSINNKQHQDELQKEKEDYIKNFLEI